MQPFSVHFSLTSDATALLDDRHVLALIEFGAAGDIREPDPRRINVALPLLGPAPLVELWTSETPVVSGVAGRVLFSHNDRILLGHLSVDERDYRDMEEATREAYEGFLPLAHEKGFPHYLRIWNYIADINGDENGVERYKRFCVGRHAGLENFDFLEHMLPAASGVGSSSGGILIYFLAAREAGVQVENPRQVSAFHYPAQYGPKSPAFSRAMIKTWGTAKHLYISGTASIIGHESKHGDNVLAQLEESLRNVDELVRSARTGHALPIHSAADLSQLKVYIRHEQDYELVRRRIHEQLGEGVPTAYLRGDLCRENLLVEVEGFFAG